MVLRYILTNWVLCVPSAVHILFLLGYHVYHRLLRYVRVHKICISRALFTHLANITKLLVKLSRAPFTQRKKLYFNSKLTSLTNYFLIKFSFKSVRENRHLIYFQTKSPVNSGMSQSLQHVTRRVTLPTASNNGTLFYI